MPELYKRGHWPHKMDFLLSCLGYVVGLGNVWRFPYICYRNGGGAFLIPYTCMLAVCGLPTFFLELILGQYHGKCPNIVFKNLAPIFQGIGYAMMVINILVAVYYNMIMAWTIFYLFASFSRHLGWDFCGNPWNTRNCFSLKQTIKCELKNMTYWGNSCVYIEQFCAGYGAMVVNATHCKLSSGTLISSHDPPNRVPPSEEYFLYYMLGISPGLEEFGGIRWELVFCLLAAWIIVAMCIIKGFKTSGKVVYFTAVFPYVVLSILLIRGITLDGALEGIKFYVIPDWNKLISAQAWGDASIQVFFSLSLGFGGLSTLSSHNKFKNNCYRDALTVALTNCGTSVFAGFVIFSIIGFMARKLNVPIDNITASGLGLSFIAYPEAVTNMPISQLWAILFFLMLFTLALDTEFTTCETLTSALYDQWPRFRKNNFCIVLLICTSGFLLSFPLCFKGGVYLFTLMDSYSAGWTLMIIGLFELIAVSWVYGIDRFVGNVEEMIGYKPNAYWKICWKYLSPLSIIGIIIFLWINYTPANFGKYILPVWANVLGWLMAFSSIILIPVFGIYWMWKAHKSRESLSNGFRPTKEWGPSIDEEEESELAASTIELSTMTRNIPDSENSEKLVQTKTYEISDRWLQDIHDSEN